MNTSSKKISTTVTVVIPTYNRADKLSRLLESIKNQTISHNIVIDVLVVDNASTDSTASNCASAGVGYIALKSNKMSSYAREVGLNEAQADYVFFIDDDNVLDTNCIATLVKQMERDLEIGICAPLMLKYHNKKEVWCAGAHLTKFYFPEYDFVHQPVSTLPHTEIVCGSDYFPNAYMIRRSILKKHNIKNNHELFPHNWGETDFGLQVKRAGYKLCTALKAITYHDIEYERTGITRISIPNAYDQARSRVLFFKKYQRDPLNRIVWILLFFPYMLIFYTRRFIKQENGLSLCKSYLIGIFAGIFTNTGKHSESHVESNHVKS